MTGAGVGTFCCSIWPRLHFGEYVYSYKFTITNLQLQIYNYKFTVTNIGYS